MSGSFSLSYLIILVAILVSMEGASYARGMGGSSLSIDALAVDELKPSIEGFLDAVSDAGIAEADASLLLESLRNSDLHPSNGGDGNALMLNWRLHREGDVYVVSSPLLPAHVESEGASQQDRPFVSATFRISGPDKKLVAYEVNRRKLKSGDDSAIKDAAVPIELK